MGIATTIVSKIGLPLLIAVGAALLLARFKDPIIGALSSGAQTIGQSLTQPIAGFFGGIGEGISNIPTLPPFPDIFGDIFNFGNGNNQSEIAGETVVVGNDPDTQITVDIPPDTVVNPDGTVGGSPPICVDCVAQSDIPAANIRFPAVFELGSDPNDIRFLTFGKIVEEFFPNDPDLQTIAIIDFANTAFVERIPVRLQDLGAFGNINKLGFISAGSKFGEGDKLALDPRDVV